MTAFATGRTAEGEAHTIIYQGESRGAARTIRTFFIMLWLSCPATGLLGWPFVLCPNRSRRAMCLCLASTAVVSALLWYPSTRDETFATGRAVVLAPLSAGAIAWGVTHGGNVQVVDGLVLVTDMDAGHGPRSGFVVGNVFLTRRTADEVDADLLAHETTHADQWAALGGWFPVAYFGSEWLTGSGSENVFEVAAGLEAGDYDG